MMTSYALEEQAKHLQSLFASAEIEINGQTKTMNLTKAREGNKVRFFIDVPAGEVGTITRRIIKSASGQICWSAPPGKFTVIKSDTDMRIEIPIEATWKEAST